MVALLISVPLVLPAIARPIHLLVLGDSLTAGHDLAHADGFQAQLAAALAARGIQAQIIDGAVSGDTTADGRSRLDWALGDGADAAIVELGANDGLRGIDPKVMQANLTAILDTLAARHIPVLLCGMYAPPNMGPDYEREFKAVFERPRPAAGLAVRSVLPGGDRRGPTLYPRRPRASQSRRRAADRSAVAALVVKLLDEVKTG